MIRFPLLAVTFAAQFAAAEPLATGERLVTPSGVDAVQAYRDVEFLNLIPEGPESLWRVQSGILQTSNDQGASWTTAPTDLLPRPLHGDWEGIQLLGAAAVAKAPFAIEYSLHPEFDFRSMALIGETILEFGRIQKQVRPGYSVPEISVFERTLSSSESARISSFRINEENFQYRLATAFPLSGTLVALDTGTDHPYVNALVFFDRTINQPVGYLPYGELSYLPSTQAFRVVEPLTRARDSADALDKARREARTIPIWADGKLNPELAQADLFSIVIKDSATTQVPPASSPAHARVAPPPSIDGSSTASSSVAAAEQLQSPRWMWLTAGALLLIIVAWALFRRRR